MSELVTRLRKPPEWFRIAFSAFSFLVFAWVVANLLWIDNGPVLDILRLVAVALVLVGYMFGWQYKSAATRKFDEERAQRRAERDEAKRKRDGQPK